jgi:phosphoribosylformylglycinamidine cyclo-ligase
MKKSRKLKYKDAGVDIDAQDRALKRIKRKLKSTYSPSVMTPLGTFGALYSLDKKRYRAPILVSSVDGVGTKLKIAFMTGIHHTVGVDLVHHCVNDIFVQGAHPLFFLDYIASGKLEGSVLEKLVEGMIRACRDTDCALIGGEVAEMPDFYRPGEYDLAGFICGIVERNKIIDGKRIKAGDFLFGIRSSGLHTNGYSLARKILFDIQKKKIDSHIEEFGRSVGEELLEPHRCYYNILKGPVSKGLIKGMAHITGGGFIDNIPRVLPEKHSAEIVKGSWPIPNIFRYLQAVGQIDFQEMFRTFNMGIGMVVIISPDKYEVFIREMKKVREKIFLIGEIVKGPRKVRFKRA